MSKTVYNWKNPRPSQQTPEMGPSVTIPEQSMSVRTLMDRYRRGMPLDLKMKNPQYHNGEFPDLTKMDISEVHELRKAADLEVNRIRQELQLQEIQKQEAARNAMEQELQQLREQLRRKPAAELP